MKWRENGVGGWVADLEVPAMGTAEAIWEPDEVVCIDSIILLTDDFEIERVQAGMYCLSDRRFWSNARTVEKGQIVRIVVRSMRTEDSSVAIALVASGCGGVR